jgi:hypothetical protein
MGELLPTKEMQLPSYFSVDFFVDAEEIQSIDEATACVVSIDVTLMSESGGRQREELRAPNANQDKMRNYLKSTKL